MNLVISTDRREDLTAPVRTAEQNGQAYRINATPIDGPFGIEWEYEMFVDHAFPSGPRAA
jgi:hypothetical protein